MLGLVSMFYHRTRQAASRFRRRTAGQPASQESVWDRIVSRACRLRAPPRPARRISPRPRRKPSSGSTALRRRV